MHVCCKVRWQGQINMFLCVQIQEKKGELDLQHVYDLLPCQTKPIFCKTDTQCTARYTDTFRDSLLTLIRLLFQTCNVVLVDRQTD